jgi:ATP-dependent Clp protease adaptor protein ClpS
MPIAPTLPRPKEKTKVKQQPPYAVVVYNDDVHTFDYVINCFMKVFGYDARKCLKLATEIHEQGRAIVWSGALEVAELKKEQIEGMGPDHMATKPCKEPLKVELEPLEG